MANAKIYKLTALSNNSKSHGVVGYFDSAEAVAAEKAKWSTKWWFTVDEIELNQPFVREAKTHGNDGALLQAVREGSMAGING